MSVQQLADSLSAIKTDQKSGKIYVYAKINKVRQVATLVVANGELIRITCSGKTGQSALAEILIMNIENIVFISQLAVDYHATAPETSDTPRIAAVLEQLKNPSNPLIHRDESNRETSKNVNILELRKEVEEVLKKVCGAGIVKEIDRMASLYSVEKNPEVFLEQCKLKAQLMLSASQVEKLFKPLYNKIKGS